MIRLSFCFSLLEPKSAEYFMEIFADYEETMTLAGVALPKNTRKYRKLDCDVFEYAYNVINESERNTSVDTARDVFVPTGEERRVWDGSWTSRGTHIEICVRNSASSLGAWLHYPRGLEISDVCQAIQVGVTGIEPEDPQSEPGIQGNDEIEED
jgi:hypothetical protein